jgi:hypothetical protein
MNGRLGFLFVSLSVLMIAHQSPAPIVEPEEKPTPAPEQSEAPKPKTKRATKSAATSEEQAPAKTETRAKPASPLTSQGPARSVPSKQKSVEASGSNSARRFDGIWQGSHAGNNGGGNYVEKFRLTVRGKSADLTGDFTGPLLDMREQHQRWPRINIKATNHSDHVFAIGANLYIIQWRGGQVRGLGAKDILAQRGRGTGRVANLLYIKNFYTEW